MGVEREYPAARPVLVTRLRARISCRSVHSQRAPRIHAPNAHRRACTRHLARKQVLVSSDLAHTHLASGPYGYSPAAEPFDLAVGRWASDPVKHVSVQSRLSTQEFLSGLSPVARQAEALLVEAARLAPDALSCGPRHIRPRTELVYLPRPLINFHRSQPTRTRARARTHTRACARITCARRRTTWRMVWVVLPRGC